MRLKTISHPNPLIESKVNYFIDSCRQFIAYAGHQHDFVIETPLSTIEGLLYQIENNTEYRLDYLDNYLHNYWLGKTEILSQFKTFDLVKTQMQKYRSFALKNNRSDKIALVDASSFQKNLVLFRDDLAHNMVDVFLDNLISHIFCSHELSEHTETIKAYAFLLMSVLLFTGRTRSELNEIVNGLFTTNIYFYPFPNEIKSAKAKKKYLKNIDTKKQLYGIKNALLQKPYKEYLLFRIIGANFPKDFEVKYDKVTFISANHNKLENVIYSIRNDYNADFFNVPNSFIAGVEVEYYSRHSLFRNSTSVINAELKYLSSITNRNYIIDNCGDYILCNKNFKHITHGYTTKKIHDTIEVNFKFQFNNNPFFFLNKVKSDAKQWLLSFERILINAANTQNVADYWHYLEVLFSFDKSREKLIQDRLSTILLCSEEEYKNFRIRETLYNCFDVVHMSSVGMGVSFEEILSIRELILRKKISPKLKRIEYPFIKEQLNEYNTRLTSIDFENSKNYYVTILIEAREYRNFYVHGGLTNKTADHRLLYAMQMIVRRMRWLIFDFIKRRPDISFKYLIEELYKKGQLVLKGS